MLQTDQTSDNNNFSENNISDLTPNMGPSGHQVSGHTSGKSFGQSSSSSIAKDSRSKKSSRTPQQIEKERERRRRRRRKKKELLPSIDSKSQVKPSELKDLPLQKNLNEVKDWQSDVPDLSEAKDESSFIKEPSTLQLQPLLESQAVIQPEPPHSEFESKSEPEPESVVDSSGLLQPSVDLPSTNQIQVSPESSLQNDPFQVSSFNDSTVEQELKPMPRFDYVDQSSPQAEPYINVQHLPSQNIEAMPSFELQNDLDQPPLSEIEAKDETLDYQGNIENLGSSPPTNTDFIPEQEQVFESSSGENFSDIHEDQSVVNVTEIPKFDSENIIEADDNSEYLKEKASSVDEILDFSRKIIRNIVVFFHKIQLNKLVRNGGGFKSFSQYLKPIFFGCFVIILAIGLYFLGASLHVSDYFYNFLNPKQENKAQIIIDSSNFNQWGINTAEIFARNQGSVLDRLNSSLKNSYFFGTLAEPIFKGQTGISAAIYYGFSLDDQAKSNQFIGYLNLLNRMKNLYSVDIYKLLSRNADRSANLDRYIQDLQSNYDQGQKSFNEIKVLTDDLKVSYNSLNSDRTRYETDFFAAMNAFAGEKADFLLKSFIDVSQKQVALKARYNALDKLALDYETDLDKLSKRIEAVQKNKDALLNGLKVIEVPGSNIDFTIQQNK